MIRIPYNRPYMTGKELFYIEKAYADGHLAGDGQFTRECSKWLELTLGCKRALLTHSCTAALEMAAILTSVGPGDEIIMPSYTFVSTANAFVLRGAKPVFVDIRPDTLNIDEQLIESAITERTRAIVVVHYAGVACEMDTIMAIAKKHRLIVIEDAAQAILSTYKGRYLGTIGHIGCLSFHETKNIISGEGGALLVNDEAYIARAEIIREKGTDRSRFLRGQVDKYTWRDIGSSYLPGEYTAAFLWAQLQESGSIISRRKAIWSRYAERLSSDSSKAYFRCPDVEQVTGHNGHIFHIVVKSEDMRNHVIHFMKSHGILTPFHYVPLHSSPAGNIYCRVGSAMTNTNVLPYCLIRLPLWVEMSISEQDDVIRLLKLACES